ncbi:flagellar biosynthesis protein FlhF [Ramlibacter sp. 2FC]|uniref:flagellar biosynthesis protein FlhF n=1 Tax=Ramlibacter sp. 2FC TaxID=2502188 RepID=UPI0010F7D764|nr:flagellar biosynthesis protein FlhF [Ramlibacter sp. 2FC]
MNVRRFIAATARDALTQVRAAFGDDGMVLATRPCAEGVEVLAMAAEGAPRHETTDAGQAASRHPPASSVSEDVQQLAMSTLSFQDYVRERMLKRRQAAPLPSPAELEPPAPAGADAVAARLGAEHERAVLDELRNVRTLIESRFGAMAFMDGLRRSPAQSQLAARLLQVGLSPALVRTLVQRLPADAGDGLAWAREVLAHNLRTGETEPALEDQGGVFALVGATGVGKTTGTAKLAAAFAARHGAAQLGLITLDAYRVGAHEQLRAYGRILGVAVHTAHDRAALDDLLDLLSVKKLVLIDTAGLAQHDDRTQELLEMLGDARIRRLLVLNAAAQGETLEDVAKAYRASECHGVVLSKVDEAVHLGTALDVLVRHKLKLVQVADGQRVPEDWHRLSAQALVQRALGREGRAAYRMDAEDLQLMFGPVPGPASEGLHA